MILGKRILIFGFGKEGTSSAKYFGKNNQVSVFDDKPREEIPREYFRQLKVPGIKFYFKNHFPSKQNFDYLIRSPSVRPDDKRIINLASKGTIVTSTTKIFFDECPAKIIGVTGTKGKGTTATLIFEMLKTQTKNVFLAGNIGTCALDILPRVTKSSLVVLELSSFQLFDLKMSPHIAVILMVTSEHLDWHKNTIEYQKAKEPIVSFQDRNDFAIVNYDFLASRNFARKTRVRTYYFSVKEKTNGTYLQKDRIVSEILGFEEICSTSRILLPGKHNIQNILAATAVAKIQKIDNKNIIQVLSSFKGLIHRLQLIREVNGIKFINDSFSTIPETTIAAIEAFKNPKILILGGSSKKSDFTKLAKKIFQDKTVKAVILIGQEAKRIRHEIMILGSCHVKIIEGVKNMREIVDAAFFCAKINDVVILSPACASFDMFKNYQDRGEQFIEEVLKLK